MIKFSTDKVLLLHQLMIAETGGANEVRDVGLLDSALQSAYATFDGVDLYPSKEEKEARLGYALISNHAFADGNKRIGMYVMLTFLEVNGIEITSTNEDVIDAGLGVAEGRMKYEDLLAWVIAHKAQRPHTNFVTSRCGQSSASNDMRIARYANRSELSLYS